MEKAEEKERQEAYADFAAALARPVIERIERGRLHTFKPVLDEGPGYRSWETMEEYRAWCEASLPDWLGYRRVTDEEWRELVERASKPRAADK